MIEVMVVVMVLIVIIYRVARAAVAVLMSSYCSGHGNFSGTGSCSDNLW